MHAQLKLFLEDLMSLELQQQAYRQKSHSVISLPTHSFIRLQFTAYGFNQ